MRRIFFLFALVFVPLASAQDISQLSSSAISEAVEQLTGQRAHMTDQIRLLSGRRLSGPAVTMHLIRDDKASATEAGLTAIKLIEAAPAGSVIVAVLDGDKDFAVFGSTFAALATSHHLTGFIVDGSVRDLSELRRLEFTTYARGTVPGSAGGHYRIDATNAVVRCGGIDVRPGDYIVADEDGIAVAPKERLPEIVKSAKKWQTDKEELVPLILKNRSYLKAMQERDAARRPK